MMLQVIGALLWRIVLMVPGECTVLVLSHALDEFHVLFCFLYISGHNNFFFCCFRLFSCGTSKEGESYIVEWNESEGAVKRTYQGFRKRSLGVVQFDTTRNRFLAAGDEFVIKLWDMDNTSLLTTIDAEGGLPVRKCGLI